VSIFRIKVVAGNPKDEGRLTLPVEALVDTSSELTWLPGGMLRAIGVKPRKKKVIPTANKETVERDVAHVILYANGHETPEKVVLAEPGDPLVIGVHALEGFGIKTDEQRFVSLTALAAFSGTSVRKAA
jgi:predicted aspartyl protease